MSDLKSKGMVAFVWDVLGKFGVHASTLIVGIVLARLLEPSDFGLLAIIMVIVSVTSIFSDLGLSGALIQRKKTLQIHYSSVFFFNISVGLLLSILTFFLAPSIANFYHNSNLVSLIQASSLLFVISAFHSVQVVLLKKSLNYELLTKVNMLASVGSGVIGIILALGGAGVWSLVIQVMAREILINIVIWNKTNWVPRFAFSLKALRQLWRYGLNMFLARLLETIYQRIDYLVIGRLFPQATLGFFYQARQLNQFVIDYSSGSLMSVLFPVLSKIQNDTKKFQRVIIKSNAIICFVVFFLLGGLYITADEVILILFGEKWAASSHYFRLLALSGFAYPISALMVNALSSRGKSKEFLQLEVYKKMIQTMTFYILYAYGIEAFLYSIVVSSGLGTLLNIKFATREIQLPILSIIKPIAIQMFITVLIVLLVQALMVNTQLPILLLFLLKGFIFSVMYLFMNWILKVKSFDYVKDQMQSMLALLKNRKLANQ